MVTQSHTSHRIRATAPLGCSISPSCCCFLLTPHLSLFISSAFFQRLAPAHCSISLGLSPELAAAHQRAYSQLPISVKRVINNVVIALNSIVIAAAPVCASAQQKRAFFYALTGSKVCYDARCSLNICFFL